MKRWKSILKWFGIILAGLVLAALIIVFTNIDFSNPEGFDDYLDAKFKKSNLAGMAVALTKRDELT